MRNAPCSDSSATPSFPSQPEGKIGLPRANPRGRLSSAHGAGALAARQRRVIRACMIRSVGPRPCSHHHSQLASWHGPRWRYLCVQHSACVLSHFCAGRKDAAACGVEASPLEGPGCQGGGAEAVPGPPAFRSTAKLVGRCQRPQQTRRGLTLLSQLCRDPGVGVRNGEEA